MRTSAIGALAFPVLVALAAPATAAVPSPGPAEATQHPAVASPGPAADQRFEVPGAGYALSFPADWTVWAPSESDVDVMLDAAGGVLGEQTAEAARTMMSMGMTYDVIGFAPAPSDEVESCYTLRAPNPVGIALDDAMTMNLFTLHAIPGLVGEPSSEVLDLPAGPAGRLDYRLRLESPDGSTIEQEQSAYLVMRAEDMLMIGCAATGREPPDDRWLSLAETLELPPDEG